MCISRLGCHDRPDDRALAWVRTNFTQPLINLIKQDVICYFQSHLKFRASLEKLLELVCITTQPNAPQHDQEMYPQEI